MGDLLHDLMTTLHQTQQVMDVAPADFSTEVHKHTFSLMSHRMMPSLYGVLSELKQKTGLSIRSNLLGDVNQVDPQLQRLDTMLIVEGVTEPPPNYNGPRPNR